jgi:lambda repressor-like predicted transcriptional regulator
MHREDIKASLRKSGISLTSLAVELGVQQSTISCILMGRRSRRLELAIARKLNRSPDEVFPDRYPIEMRGEKVFKKTMTV